METRIVGLEFIVKWGYFFRVSELVFALFENFLQDSSGLFVGKGAGLSMNCIPFSYFAQSPLPKSRDALVLRMFCSVEQILAPEMGKCMF